MRKDFRGLDQSLKSFKLGRKKYKIEYKWPADKKDLKCQGYYDPNTQTIVINSRLKGFNLACVLIHEILHVMQDHGSTIEHRHVYELDYLIAKLLSQN